MQRGETEHDVQELRRIERCGRDWIRERRKAGAVGRDFERFDAPEDLALDERIAHRAARHLDRLLERDRLGARFGVRGRDVEPIGDPERLHRYR